MRNFYECAHPHPSQEGNLPIGCAKFSPLGWGWVKMPVRQEELQQIPHHISIMNEQIIFCVDDEKVVLNSLKRQLYDIVGESMVIETAESGEEAIEVFRELHEQQQEIPLVISDHIMPGMKGADLLQRVHELSPRTMTVMLTGQADMAAVIHAVNHANLYRYIPKPWEQTDLFLTVKEALHKYEQEKTVMRQNQMLSGANQELERLNQELTAYSHTLEQRVAERTAALAQANDELLRLANLDGLTRVANRRRFDEYFAQEWKRLARERRPLSLIMCDIDYFKRYNDTYGHLMGDECLKRVADALMNVARRPADLTARYGGEEFSVILPNTDADGAMLVANAIQQGVEALRIEHAASNAADHVTISVGVSTLIPRHDGAISDLIGMADIALYEAKTHGRNRVAVSSHA